MRSIAYRDAKKKIEDLTKEVENLKSKLEDKAYNFKKYDHSSEIATKLIECHAKWESNIKNKKKPSFGCCEPPPYNHNYFSYTNDVKVNVTDASTSCADKEKVIVEEWTDDDEDVACDENLTKPVTFVSANLDNSTVSTSKTCVGSPVLSIKIDNSCVSVSKSDVVSNKIVKKPAVDKYRPPKFVRPTAEGARAYRNFFK